MSDYRDVAKAKSPRLRVLIADDVHETRRSARLMMTLLPTVEVVAIAQDGRQAIEMVQKHSPDIVLMDINMPEMDGLTALERIVDQHPEVACIIMSAQKDSDTLRVAMANGARGYLIKPFTTDELVEEIERLVKVVWRDRKRNVQTAQLQIERDTYLKDLAREYVRRRRADEKARDVLEQLVSDPNCETKWLIALATIYLVRREWGKLKLLAERLERL